jgi:hypothetical protein
MIETANVRSNVIYLTRASRDLIKALIAIHTLPASARLARMNQFTMTLTFRICHSEGIFTTLGHTTSKLFRKLVF